MGKKKETAPRDPNAPRYPAPSPAPKQGDEVLYIPDDIGREPVQATVSFVHQDLDGRVVNLNVPNAEGAILHLGVAYFPHPFFAEDAEEPEIPPGHSWHWPQ